MCVTASSFREQREVVSAGAVRPLREVAGRSGIFERCRYYSDTLYFDGGGH